MLVDDLRDEVVDGEVGRARSVPPVWTRERMIFSKYDEVAESTIDSEAGRRHRQDRDDDLAREELPPVRQREDERREADAEQAAPGEGRELDEEEKGEDESELALQPVTALEAR